MLNNFFKNRIFIILILIAICFIPSSISRPAQTVVRSVVIGVGIDKSPESDDKVELSAQIIVPHYDIGFNENAQVISADGPNVTEAFENLSVHIGKIIGLSHCSIIAFGESMKNENIAKTLDWFYRSKRLDSNASIIYTEGSAKKLLETSLQADNNLSLSLNSIMQFNEPLSFAKKTEIIPFLQAYYSKNESILVPIINLTSLDYEGLSVKEGSSGEQTSGGGGGSGGGSPSGESNENQQQFISNDGDAAIFKNGRFVAKILKDEVRGFNDLTGKTQKGIAILENVTDENLTNAQVAITKRGLTKTYKVGFSKQGIPRIEYNLNYTAKVEQILQDNIDITILDGYKDYVSKKVKEKFSDFIKQSCADAVNISKENNVDCLKIYEKFSSFDRKRWEKYLSSLENRDDYIQNVEFFVNVNVRGID